MIYLQPTPSNKFLVALRRVRIVFRVMTKMTTTFTHTAKNLYSILIVSLSLVRHLYYLSALGVIMCVV